MYVYIYTCFCEWGMLDFFLIIVVQLTVVTVVYRGQAETYPTWLCRTGIVLATSILSVWVKDRKTKHIGQNRMQ